MGLQRSKQHSSVSNDIKTIDSLFYAYSCINLLTAIPIWPGAIKEPRAGSFTALAERCQARSNCFRFVAGASRSANPVAPVPLRSLRVAPEDSLLSVWLAKRI